jgi:hypothetical protein
VGNGARQFAKRIHFLCLVKIPLRLRPLLALFPQRLVRVEKLDRASLDFELEAVVRMLQAIFSLLASIDHLVECFGQNAEMARSFQRGPLPGAAMRDGPGDLHEVIDGPGDCLRDTEHHGDSGSDTHDGHQDDTAAFKNGRDFKGRHGGVFRSSDAGTCRIDRSHLQVRNRQPNDTQCADHQEEHGNGPVLLEAKMERCGILHRDARSCGSTRRLPRKVRKVDGAALIIKPP